jgi:hypothetical protein
MVDIHQKVAKISRHGIKYRVQFEYAQDVNATILTKIREQGSTPGTKRYTMLVYMAKTRLLVREDKVRLLQWCSAVQAITCSTRALSQV